MSIATFTEFFSKASDSFIEQRRHDYLAQLQDLEWRREAIEARLKILNDIMGKRKGASNPPKEAQKTYPPITGPMK